MGVILTTHTVTNGHVSWCTIPAFGKDLVSRMEKAQKDYGHVLED
jgi:hypothetical protein